MTRNAATQYPTATHFITAFESQVKLRMKRHGESRSAATRAVIRQKPNLHARYVDQFNSLSPEHQASIRKEQRI